MIVSGEELCIARWFAGGDELSTASGDFGLGLKNCLNEWRRLGDVEPGM